jgi:two-component system KDP operon response regulator KdpE
VVRLEGVEINLVTRRALVGGCEIRLTPKEFDLLNYLVSNANVPIPHRRLLQAVWGPDSGDQVEYLRVFVNQLRKKIEPDQQHPRYLVSVRGLGYRFDG